ncbi:MAG TPA: hypothetical protein PLJ71_02425 [Candidatus Hydrogenedentes bacterium]|nr:hypothetical protein [Candidatus Hydrogenedentota bacterium]HQM47510.1 hypothetical protein [Candidatus Hydrogenedentota bacterium]
MDKRQLIIHMLRQLDEQSRSIQQVGAGYYSCVPFARRFNKLLAESRTLFGASDSLMGTFEDIAEFDPKDPTDKMKIIQGIRVEINQLIALLEVVPEGGVQ